MSADRHPRLLRATGLALVARRARRSRQRPGDPDARPARRHGADAPGDAAPRSRRAALDRSAARSNLGMRVVQTSTSRWSLWSEDSLLSIGSKGSILSI